MVRKPNSELKLIRSTKEPQLLNVQIHDYAPEHKVAAMGLLLRLFANGESDYHNCFIQSPDGTIITYHEAFLLFEEVVSDYVTCNTHQ